MATTTEGTELSSWRSTRDIRRSLENASEAPTSGSTTQNMDDGQSAPVPSSKYQVMLLLAGFVMIFQIIGINTTFGVFQEFYASSRTSIVDAQGQDALVSLVGTIGSGLTWSGSIFVNPLMARVKNVKLVALTGAFIMSLGLALASFSTRLWHLFLTQAILYGLGSSMYYFPIIAIAPMYFDRHRGFAMGFILAGSGIGGLVLAPVQQYLMDRYGVQWTLRILGMWNFAVGIPVSMVIQHRQGFGYERGATRARTRLGGATARRGTFWYQAFGAFLQAGGNIVPLYYMTSYSVSVLSLSRSTGSLFLSINSAVNSISRIAMGVLADYIGRQNTLIGGVILSALSVFALWYDAPKDRFTSFVVLYGIYAGGYNALLPTTITEIYGVENYASVNGALLFIRGLGSIFGAPLAGLILGSHTRTGFENQSVSGNAKVLQKKYNQVVIYDGVLLIASALCVVYVRWLDARDKGRWKWKA
ncbi:MFS general substrate transporter [Marasmius fiardii PR-910]|nr:MFS general substrate transporter [Marasmius fiardii PR-910]